MYIDFVMVTYHTIPKLATYRITLKLVNLPHINYLPHNSKVSKRTTSVIKSFIFMCSSMRPTIYI